MIGTDLGYHKSEGATCWAALVIPTGVVCVLVRECSLIERRSVLWLGSGDKKHIGLRFFLLVSTSD